MNAIADWLAMGGYALFVWPAYALTAVVLGALAFDAWRRHRRSGADLERLQRPADSGE